MEQKTYQKNELVRDGIVSSIKEQGGKVEHRILCGQQKTRAQLEKQVAEAQELLETFIQTGRVSLKELVDVSEIRKQIIEDSEFTLEQVEEARLARRQEMGGFAGGWFVDSITPPPDGEWAEYFAADPARFPEVKG